MNDACQRSSDKSTHCKCLPQHRAYNFEQTWHVIAIRQQIPLSAKDCGARSTFVASISSSCCPGFEATPTSVVVPAGAIGRVSSSPASFSTAKSATDSEPVAIVVASFVVMWNLHAGAYD
eukprot:1679072-Amphidinium_carterae.1